jgi:hypothetical protein
MLFIIYNKEYVFNFLNDDNNKKILLNLKKFNGIDLTDANTLINIMKISKQSIKYIYEILNNNVIKITLNFIRQNVMIIL